MRNLSLIALTVLLALQGIRGDVNAQTPTSGRHVSMIPAAPYDSSFTVKGKTIMLPEKSRLLSEVPCSPTTKRRLEPIVGRIARCIGQFDYNGTVFVAYQNINRTPDRPGGGWMFAIGSKITDLGTLSVKDWVQATVWNDRYIEFLATNLEAVASSTPSNPPYARYRVVGPSNDPALELISPGPRISGMTLIERDMARFEQPNATSATTPGPIALEAISGEWQDGGPACVSIARAPAAEAIVFRGWYCEAGEKRGTPLTLERHGNRGFRHKATDLLLLVHSDRVITVEAGPRSRKQFGSGLYVPEDDVFGKILIRRVYYKASSANRSAAETATPPQLSQLRTGAYVMAGTACSAASNATLQWWNGQFFSGGRQHNAYPELASQNHYVATTRGWEDNRVARVPITVISRTEYERDGVRFGHCPEPSLPPTWRGETPLQKNMSAGPVVAVPEAAESPVSRREFREWKNSSKANGYRCTVRVESGSLALRSAPGGRQVATLSNGDEFILQDVQMTEGGETWYQALSLGKSGQGWVSSRYASCGREHFD